MSELYDGCCTNYGLKNSCPMYFAAVVQMLGFLSIITVGSFLAYSRFQVFNCFFVDIPRYSLN